MHGESRKAKQLTPPFYRLTAICPRHGTVQVERKPNRKAGQKTESGGVEPPHPGSIVCPRCVYHARVTSAEFVPIGYKKDEKSEKK